MIGRLRGHLAEKHVAGLLIDVGGVGYEVEVPLSTYVDLPEAGAEVTLYTHLVVRDDLQLLYGFSEERARTLFRSLIKVNGVGPKLALAILSGMSVEEFARCVQAEDARLLVKLPGVGKKTAERLVIEMRDRLDELQVPQTDTVVFLQAGAGDDQTGPAHHRLLRDAESALIALGYRPAEAALAIAGVDLSADDEAMPVERLVTEALKNMGG